MQFKTEYDLLVAQMEHVVKGEDMMEGEEVDRKRTTGFRSGDETMGLYVLSRDLLK